MLHQGFKNVFHLEGGIINYANQVKEQGLENKFLGKNFVFDNLKTFDKSAQDINNQIKDPMVKFKYINVTQDNFITDEKRIDSFKPKYITTLTIKYEYTK